jgi:hypothetical protein
MNPENKFPPRVWEAITENALSYADAMLAALEEKE